MDRCRRRRWSPTPAGPAGAAPSHRPDRQRDRRAVAARHPLGRRLPRREHRRRRHRHPCDDDLSDRSRRRGHAPDPVPGGRYGGSAGVHTGGGGGHRLHDRRHRLPGRHPDMGDQRRCPHPGRHGLDRRLHPAGRGGVGRVAGPRSTAPPDTEDTQRAAGGRVGIRGRGRRPGRPHPGRRHHLDYLHARGGDDPPAHPSVADPGREPTPVTRSGRPDRRSRAPCRSRRADGPGQPLTPEGTPPGRHPPIGPRHPGGGHVPRHRHAEAGQRLAGPRPRRRAHPDRGGPPPGSLRRRRGPLRGRRVRGDPPGPSVDRGDPGRRRGDGPGHAPAVPERRDHPGAVDIGRGRRRGGRRHARRAPPTGRHCAVPRQGHRPRTSGAVRRVDGRRVGPAAADRPGAAPGRRRRRARAALPTDRAPRHRTDPTGRGPAAVASPREGHPDPGSVPARGRRPRAPAGDRTEIPARGDGSHRRGQPPEPGSGGADRGQPVRQRARHRRPPRSRRGPRRQRARTGDAGAGDHRGRDRRRVGPSDPGRAAESGGDDRHRRLRHRQLVAAPAG